MLQWTLTNPNSQDQPSGFHLTPHQNGGAVWICKGFARVQIKGIRISEGLHVL